jgi:hypothetical protein
MPPSGLIRKGWPHKRIRSPKAPRLARQSASVSYAGFGPGSECRASASTVAVSDASRFANRNANPSAALLRLPGERAVLVLIRLLGCFQALGLGLGHLPVRLCRPVAVAVSPGLVLRRVSHPRQASASACLVRRRSNSSGPKRSRSPSTASRTPTGTWASSRGARRGRARAPTPFVDGRALCKRRACAGVLRGANDVRTRAADAAPGQPARARDAHSRFALRALA